ncbi:MAG: VWA domain-containing protein [Bacteroidaceae bacterium]|nr:VWA domain-containing protein [Bacteroidaceae bacterium]
MMKRVISIILLGCFASLYIEAAPQLPSNCSAFQPPLLKKKTIKESEVNELLKSGNWGQTTKDSNSKYWTAYSDRSHNTTYNTSSTSGGKCDELDFNEQVRIAKIENGFALVYTENQKGVTYPLISSSAQSRGWIPMKNLLLWSSCPTDEAGIYNKALIVLNIDEQRKGNSDLGKRYQNPETKDDPKKLVADMNFYFVMKKADNGLVLLARECKMEGYTYQVLYGWVSTSSYVPWSQRTCIEPNWKPLVAEQLKGKRVNVYRDGSRATDIELGRMNKITKNEATKFRLEPQLMRYPLLGNKSETQYHVTAFARPDGTSHVPTVPSGYDNTSAGTVTDGMEDLSIINLIVVIDGTRSMENYYQPTQKIIQQAYEYFEKESRTVNVGIVIYRDYTDGQYVTEHLSMRTPTDPSVAQFLQSGGSYGVKSSSSDHTLAEALYKGLEVALDTKTMNYSSRNSNLMFVIGDCGNDLADNKCISQEDIVRKCVENRVQLSAFQVRNENEQSFLLFRKQMGAIVRENLKAQYSKLGGNFKAGFKELADGYRFATDLPAKDNFYIGETRNADLGKAMDVSKLYDLVKNSYIQFGTAIDAQMGIVSDAENIIRESGENSTNSSIEMGLLESIFSKEQIREIKKSNSLMAFQGDTDKKAENGLDYWQSIIYISSDEFAQLMEKLQPVMAAANTGNRKPYVDAIKELTRSMIPDITPKEMDEKDVKEIMALVAGLNVKTGSLGGRTLIQIQDDKIVKQDEFDGMIADFRNKYNKLKKIRENKYDFSVERNKTTWYWIPVEDLP